MDNCASWAAKEANDQSKGQKKAPARSGNLDDKERALIFDKDLTRYFGELDHERWDVTLSVCGGCAAVSTTPRTFA